MLTRSYFPEELISNQTGHILKRFFATFSALFIVLAAVVIVRTFMHVPAPQRLNETITLDIDAQSISRHMSEAIQFKTVSNQPPTPLDPKAFNGFIAWLEATYPEVHATMARELIADYTILLKWQGTNPTAKPILLTGHYDVVPVLPGSKKQWTHPPYAGLVEDGWIWGRGALDDKSGVIAQLEAATYLIKQGFLPNQTIYFSFAHDEELNGFGAQSVTQHFKDQNIQLDWSLDEGGFLVNGLFPGINKPIAAINVAEKGFLSVELIATGAGGHSSTPPRETAIGILAQAILNVEDAPLPSGMEGMTDEMYDQISRHMPFEQRMMFANQWLFGYILTSLLSDQPLSNALMRTTTAPTMLNGSIKENVLPIKAVAVINFRLHPRDTIESVVHHVKTAIDDDRIEINIMPGASGASPISSTKSDSFIAIAATTREVFGDVLIAPGVLMAATDSRFYGTVADDSYRFNPILVDSDILSTFHGTNERIAVDSVVQATTFFAQLIKTVAGPK